MPENKSMTGYPSIDKPWLKYYSIEAINAPLPECSIYEYLRENNKNHLDDTALIYFGRKITYRALFDGIDIAAKGLAAHGVHKGDIVSVVSVSTPEVVYAFYAINNIGAVSNWIDLRKANSEIVDMVKACNSSVCFVFEGANSHLCEDLSTVGCTCIRISIADSLPFPLNVLYRLKTRKKQPSMKCLSWDAFISAGKGATVISANPTPDDLAVLEYTGGTTGVSKAVMLTNKNINSVVSQYDTGGCVYTRGESWLSIAFPFIAYSLICSIHMPLTLGMIGVLCFDVEAKQLKSTLTKYRCNHMTNTPITWTQLAADQNDRQDYSFLVMPTVGADSLSISKEEEINRFLESHGSKYPLCKGYGMTELSSAVTVTHGHHINKPGSVGIPFSHMTVSIFDPDTGEELKYGEQGEICVTGPSVMLGYYQNAEATDEVLRKHDDGLLWLHSGDCGHVDEDGFLFIDGRYKRIIIDYIGYKTFAPMVERVINDLPVVEKSCVVGADDMEHGTGQLPIAFVVLKSGSDSKAAEKQIQAVFEKELPEYSWPRSIIFTDDFPYTGAGKVDYRKLEEIAKEKLFDSLCASSGI